MEDTTNLAFQFHFEIFSSVSIPVIIHNTD